VRDIQDRGAEFALQAADFVCSTTAMIGYVEERRPSF